MKHSIKPKARGSKQLFSSPLLERLSRTHIAVPLALYAAVSGGLLYYGVTETGMKAGTVALVLVLGFLSFTLLEYVAHRIFFHMPPTSRWREKVQ
ncbi:hypothetical protein ACFS7Z_26360 [Pontibacter toksunensis]|uniref:Fatty acid desaturase n=1 Tax=Pontibacter toksunensis TaxID=1332631 RepID=A0ABW6C4T1_9BACT